MQIDKPFLRAVRVDIDAALAAIAKKHGLQSLTTGATSYTANRFTMKLEATAEGGLTKEAERYTSSAADFLKLPPLGSPFTTGGRKYKTSGLNTTGSKVLCDRDDGKTFLFAVDTCKALVTAQVQA